MKNREYSINGIQNVLGFCHNLSILYIENNYSNSNNSTQEMLEGIFKNLLSEKSAKSGIKEFKRYFQSTKNFYDIVLIDIEMSVIDNYEISRAILDINDKQIIIINSTYDDTDNLLKLIELGVNYFLKKPIHFKELLQILTKISNNIYNMQLTHSYAKELELLNSTLHKTVDELKYTTKSKDDFFANISHEIRTPMNAIIGLTHLIKETDLNKKQLDYINKIKSSGDHLLSLVNDILDFSKIEAGQLDIENIEFNINTTLDNISNMITIKAQEKGLEIIYDIDNSVPALIKGDPLRLSQVIINLMNNAIKFTEKGEITLKAKMSPLPNNKKLLIFEVIDTGIGLTKEQIGKLFKSFSQADASISRKYGGTGLGLMISKQLVELMGGSIRVVSEYGEGSRFIFSIVTEKPYLRSYRLPSRSFMSKDVLIIEANPKTSSALKEMFNYFRYKSIIASNIDEAQELFKNDSFDILCIDKKIISEINALLVKKHCSAKIVLMESNLDKSDDKIYKNIMIDAHLSKPFNQEMIFKMILELFSKEDVKSSNKNRKITKDNLQDIRGSHILLAEDNSINQAVMSGLLEDTGIKLTIANNGEEAISYSKKLIDIDLILMDMNMPIIDGDEATRVIRKDLRYKFIPIIALSGDTQEKDIKKAEESGVDEYLVKPINVQKFYKILLKYIMPKAKALQNREIDNKHINNKVNKNIFKKELVNRNILNINLGLHKYNQDEKLYIHNLLVFIKITKKSVIKLIALIKIDDKQKITHLISQIKKYSKRIIAPTVVKDIINLEKAIIENNSVKEKLLIYQKSLNTLVKVIKEFIKSKDVIKSKEIAILDEKEALSKLRNNGEEYQSILFEFAEVFQNSPELLEELIKNNEFDKAIKLIKSIKDTAKNISANRLFNISEKLEISFIEKSFDNQKIIEVFDLELNSLLSMIDTFRKTQ